MSANVSLRPRTLRDIKPVRHGAWLSDVQFVTLRESIEDRGSDARDTPCYNIDGCAE